jgi:hypothetical protein
MIVVVVAALLGACICYQADDHFADQAAVYEQRLKECPGSEQPQGVASPLQWCYDYLEVPRVSAVRYGECRAGRRHLSSLHFSWTALVMARQRATTRSDSCALCKQGVAGSIPVRSITPPLFPTPLSSLVTISEVVAHLSHGA